jgi:hypothetical protein
MLDGPRPPEDSLSVPLEGGLLGPIPTSIGAREISVGFGGAMQVQMGQLVASLPSFHRCGC